MQHLLPFLNVSKFPLWGSCHRYPASLFTVGQAYDRSRGTRSNPVNAAKPLLVFVAFPPSLGFWKISGHQPAVSGSSERSLISSEPDFDRVNGLVSVGPSARFGYIASTPPRSVRNEAGD
jgi:hypothetical protein